ncbi:MAG: hypothetical protein K9J06_04695 [Flavobacteriales bacterium]|nr:hypothetical protein [Flavobacteriales bacterium]
MSSSLASHTPPFPSSGRSRLTLWTGDNSGSQNLMALVPLFFLCAFVIYFLLDITLIPLLEASRWLVMFGAVGFLLLYILRNLMRLDLTDGLILSIFGLAPLLMAGMLTINWYFSTPFSETHRILDVERSGSMAVIHLENDAYENFYRIRKFDADEVGRAKKVTFLFGEGVLGWTVKHGHSWN